MREGYGARTFQSGATRQTSRAREIHGAPLDFLAHARKHVSVEASIYRFLRMRICEFAKEPLHLKGAFAAETSNPLVDNDLQMNGFLQFRSVEAAADT